MRDCHRYRDAISARLDGEEPGLPDESIDAHLGACADCRTWTVAAGRVTASVVGPEAPALSASVVADLIDAAAPTARRRGGLGEWRVALALIAAAQLVLAWPGGVLDDGHATAHTANELASWDLGLAVGFVVLAWLPSRAWGALPVVGVMVAFLAWTSVSDLLGGRAEPVREAAHTLQVAGLACAGVLARRVPRTPVVLRLTSTG